MMYIGSQFFGDTIVLMWMSDPVPEATTDMLSMLTATQPDGLIP